MISSIEEVLIKLATSTLGLYSLNPIFKASAICTLSVIFKLAAMIGATNFNSLATVSGIFLKFS